jgi:hypothetical protein
MTQGESLSDAMEMAADLIETLAVELEDDGKPLPGASPVKSINTEKWARENAPDGSIRNVVLTLVSADVEMQRKKQRNMSVRRNVSLPAWLDAEAARSGINVSAVLQDALKKELHIA